MDFRFDKRLKGRKIWSASEAEYRKLYASLPDLTWSVVGFEDEASDPGTELHEAIAPSIEIRRTEHGFEIEIQIGPRTSPPTRVFPTVVARHSIVEVEHGATGISESDSARFRLRLPSRIAAEDEVVRVVVSATGRPSFDREFNVTDLLGRWPERR
jgi:hypothetical protein